MEWNNNGAIHYYSWVVSSIHWIFILLRTIFTSILHVRVIGSRNENHLICRYTLSANNVKTIETKIQKCQVSCTNLFDLLFWVQSDNAMKCERHRKISKCLNLLCELRPSCSTIQPVFKIDVLFCVPILLHNLVHAYVAPYNNEHIFLLLGNDMITKETNFSAIFPITSNILPA